MMRRERYLCDGPDGLADADLLAIVLGTGVGGRTSVHIAQDLLERFGDAGAMLRHQPGELAAVTGVGLARALRIHAALELARRGLHRTPPDQVVRCPEDAWALLGPALASLGEEELHGLYLDRRRRVLARRRLTRGSDAFTVVDARQVFRVALGVGASAVLLAHNHPSGDPTPSAQDREVTERVARAGRVLGVPLVDHLVVGAGCYTSLAEEGLLPPWSPAPPSWTA
ncbi:MAG: DNA repair protein RadC [Myxococcales bacterium]|nr:DNA repair protein RadC [Myxococcales bacterium]